MSLRATTNQATKNSFIEAKLERNPKYCGSGLSPLNKINKYQAPTLEDF